MRLIGTGGALLAIASVALATSAWARPGADGDAAPEADVQTASKNEKPPATSLAPVTVTAQRREEQQQKVPLAVTAVSGEFLRDAGADQFDQIQFFVPAFESEPNVSPFLSTFRLRGLGNLANIPNFEPEVGLFVDGAYRSRSGIGSGDLLDVERVEILRGPQSVLYPKNVSAGLINIITRSPGNVPTGYLGFDLGNLDRRDVHARVSGPFNDAVRGSLSVARDSAEGSFDDRVNDKHDGGITQSAGRAQLAFDLGEQWKLRLIAGASSRHGDCCAPDLLPGAFSTALITASGRAIDTDPFNRVTAYNDPSAFDGRQSDLLADLGYDLGWATLSSLTSVDRYRFDTAFDADQTALDILRFRDRQKAHALGQELRLASQGSTVFDWMLGAYYYDNHFVRGTLDPDHPTVIVGQDIGNTPFPGVPGDSTAFQSRSDTRHRSLFAHAGWQATEQLKFAAGARYIDEHNAINVSSVSSIAAVPSLALLLYLPTPVIAARSTDGVAWNVSAQYAASKTVDFYAAVARGFKAGGFNGDWDVDGTLTPDRREFADEKALNVELGMKGRFFDDQASANLTLFDARYDDFQNASFVGTNFVVRNAREVRVRGIEFDGEARAARWLLLNYAASYVDAEYDRFRNGPCYFGRAPTDAVAGVCDLSGRSLPNAPHWRGSLGAQFERDSAYGRALLRLDWAYSSAQLTDFALDPRTRQGAFSTWNLRLALRGEQWNYALWCRNLTDHKSITLTAPQIFFGGLDGGEQYFLADPRTFGASIEYRFR